MVRMTVLPLEGGNPGMKSKEMLDQGRLGTDRGCNRPEGAWLLVLL